MTTPLSEIEAPEADYLIWWTNQEDCRRVEELGAAGLLDLWPKYLHGQYESRSGRAGRGRLWVDDSFPVRGAAWNDGAPFCKIAADAAGIVIKAHDVWHVIALPGFITTVDMTVYASDLLQRVRALTEENERLKKDVKLEHDLKVAHIDNVVYLRSENMQQATEITDLRAALAGIRG